MSEQPEETPIPESIVLNVITVTAILDEEGDPAITVGYSPGIQISEALGLLEYAKHTMLSVYEQNRAR